MSEPLTAEEHLQVGIVLFGVLGIVMLAASWPLWLVIGIEAYWWTLAWIER